VPFGLHERLRLAADGRSNRIIAELTGVPTETVRRYMGGQGPSAEFLTRFCASMGISADWLLLGRGAMRSDAESEAAPADPAGPADMDDIDSVPIARLADQVDALRLRLDRLERRARALTAPRAQQNGRAIAG